LPNERKRFAPDGIPGAHAGRIVSARPRWELAKPMNVADGLVYRIRKARSASGLRLDPELRPAQKPSEKTPLTTPGTARQREPARSRKPCIRNSLRCCDRRQQPERAVRSNRAATPVSANPTLPASEEASIESGRHVAVAWRGGKRRALHRLRLKFLSLFFPWVFQADKASCRTRLRIIPQEFDIEPLVAVNEVAHHMLL